MRTKTHQSRAAPSHRENSVITTARGVLVDTVLVVAEFVVPRALLCVPHHRVRVRDLLELGLCLGVVGVLVGVPFLLRAPRQASPAAAAEAAVRRWARRRWPPRAVRRARARAHHRELAVGLLDVRFARVLAHPEELPFRRARVQVRAAYCAWHMAREGAPAPGPGVKGGDGGCGCAETQSRKHGSATARSGYGVPPLRLQHPDRNFGRGVCDLAPLQHIRGCQRSACGWTNHVDTFVHKCRSRRAAARATREARRVHGRLRRWWESSEIGVLGCRSDLIVVGSGHRAAHSPRFRFPRVHFSTEHLGCDRPQAGREKYGCTFLLKMGGY